MAATVTCRLCNQRMKVLNIHVLNNHNVTWASYKAKFSDSINCANRVRSASSKKDSTFKQKLYRTPWTRELVAEMLQWWPHFGTYELARRFKLRRSQIKSKANKLRLTLLPDSQRSCIDCLKPGHWKRTLRCHDCALIHRQKSRRSSDKPIDQWMKELIRTARYRSKQACDLTFEYMLSIWKQQNNSCYYCGDPLKPSSYETRRDRKTASIDRLDAAKGYIQNNVAWSCWGCNWMKSKMTVNEFVTVCSRVAHHRGTLLSLDHDKVASR